MTPSADRSWLLAAIEESRKAPMSTTAYSVGAIVVDADGHEVARGHSREADPQIHAEESALSKLSPVRLSGAIMYTSLEPCGARRSRPHTCAGLIIDAGIRRVVFALREPPTFVDGQGAELLRRAGVDVIEVAELADLVREINRHVIADGPVMDERPHGPAIRGSA
jgi:pyrimidine deaminase RibD-like protein